MYLIDANILIEAKNRYYGLDFAPGFWDWLMKTRAIGRVFSIEAVRIEIERQKDDLSVWSKNSASPLYLTPRASATTQFRRLTAWANGHQQYTAPAKRDFLASADYFLVAQAADLGFTVVTHEVPAPHAKKRIKIPEACAEVGVRHCLPWSVLRSEGALFIS
jgi:Domain of unknown function (DUF4411)